MFASAVDWTLSRGSDGQQQQHLCGTNVIRKLHHQRVRYDLRSNMQPHKLPSGSATKEQAIATVTLIAPALLWHVM